MAMGDMYEVTIQSRFNDRECANVFWYYQNLPFITVPTVPPSQSLGNWFLTDIFAQLRLFVDNSVLFHTLRVRNLYDDSDSAVYPLSVRGAFGGVINQDTFPEFVAWSFELQTDNGAVRNGFKRIPGVPEAAAYDGQVIPSGGLWIDFQGFEGVLTYSMYSLLGADELFMPVVVKRVREGVPGAYTYRLPASQAEQVFGRIIVAVAELALTSQVSRKG